MLTSLSAAQRTSYFSSQTLLAGGTVSDSMPAGNISLLGLAVHYLAGSFSAPCTLQQFRACRASEIRGKLTNAGAMVYDLLGAVVNGIRLLSYNVTLENPAFNNMMRILARVLHVPALAALHSPIIGVVPLFCEWEMRYHPLSWF